MCARLSGRARSRAYYELCPVGLLFSGKAVKPDFKKLKPYQRDQAAIQFALVDEFRQNIGKIRRDRLLVLSTILAAVPVLLGLSEVGWKKRSCSCCCGQRIGFLQISIFLIILAVVDYGYQRYSHRKNLMMSKQEVKEEFKANGR